MSPIAASLVLVVASAGCGSSAKHARKPGVDPSVVAQPGDVTFTGMCDASGVPRPLGHAARVSL